MVDRFFEYLMDYHPLIFDLVIAIPAFGIAWILCDIIAHVLSMYLITLLS